MFARKRWMMAAGLLFAVGCNSATKTDTNRSEPTTKVVQPLGEATQAYWFEGNGSSAMPDYEERVAWHIINQFRMNTDVFDIRDMDGNLIPPQPPMTQQTGMTEAGRWQGAQSLEYTCYCILDQMSMTFQQAGAGNNPYTCCTAGFDDGSIACTGPVVGCGDDGMMEPADRWGLLNKGPGEIRSEIFWTAEGEEPAQGAVAANWFVGNALGSALGDRTNAGAAARTSIPLIPQECQPEEGSCESGDCLGPAGETTCDPDAPDAPNECIGECEGGPKDGEFCTIPEPLDPAVCAPENYPRGWYWSFLFGQTSEPTPFLNDVVHTAAFSEDGIVSIFTNYYDELGEPQLLQVVTDSGCHDMTRTFERPGEGMGGGADAGGTDAGTDDGLPYAGNTYDWEVSDVGSGCVRYVVHALDAEGFEQTHPTFGSLGMRLSPAGALDPDPELCPIWMPDTRPAPACLPDVNECTNGSTRLCYTGRPGTQDKGICGAGEETCVDGRWSGLCEGEARPESTETCGDDEDDNCNGFVDEDCPIMIDPTPEPDMGAGGGEDMGMGGEEDMGSGGEPPMDDGDDDEGGCCTTVDGSQSGGSSVFALFALVGALILRRRTR